MKATTTVHTARSLLAQGLLTLLLVTLLAACGAAATPQAATGGSAGATSPTPTATTAPAGGAPTTVVATARGTAATTTSGAGNVPSQRPTPDPQSIALGTPVVLKTGLRNVVAVAVTNTGETTVSFDVKPRFTGTGKPITQPLGSVSFMPPGATWTISLIADEVGARQHDLLDLRVEGLYTVPQAFNPDDLRKFTLTAPVVTPDGPRPTATFEATNGHAERRGITVQVLLTRGGTLTGIAQLAVVLEAGQTRKLSLPIDGTAEGAEARTAVINFAFRP